MLFLFQLAFLSTWHFVPQNHAQAQLTTCVSHIQVLTTLGTAELRAGVVTAQVVAAIAAIELPLGQWEDVIRLMLHSLQTTDNTNLKQCTLQAIGFVCESIVSCSDGFTWLLTEAHNCGCYLLIWFHHNSMCYRIVMF